MLAYRELNHKTSEEGIATRILPMIGLYLIAYSVLFFDGKTPHPSYHTLIPIVGVALIIGFASKDELVGRVLGSKPFVGVGLVSYSAYLWHFPIFAFYRIGLFEEATGRKATAALIIFTFLLSALSYQFIERPFRNKVGRKPLIVSILLSLALITTFSSYVILSKGVASYFRLGFDPNIIATAEPSYLYGDKGCDNNDAIYFNKTQFCVIGDTSKSNVDFLLVGDSHAMHAQPLLIKISNRFGLKGIFGGVSGCPPLLGIYPLRGRPHPSDQSKRCYGFNQNGYEFVKANDVKTVFLVARWDYYVDGGNKGALVNISDVSLQFGDINQTRRVYREAVKRTFEAYRATGAKVVVVLQVPYQNTNVKRFLQKLLKVDNAVDRDIMFVQSLKDGVPIREHLLRQKIASSAWKELVAVSSKSNLIIIDPTSTFCSTGRCGFITESYAIYTDFDHASEQGYERLETSFANALGF